MSIEAKHLEVLLKALRVARLMNLMKSMNPEGTPDHDAAVEVLGITKKISERSAEIDDLEFDSPEYEAGVLELENYLKDIEAIAEKRLAA